MSSDQHERPLRICVVTACEAAQEPRAPRHAAAIARLGADFEVVFLDNAPVGKERQPVKALAGHANLAWQTHRFATRASGVWRLVWQRGLQKIAQLVFRAGGPLWPVASSARVVGMERQLKKFAADIYLAHTIEALLPAHRAAKARGARLMFDSMEFHSDMGDSQTALDRAMTREIEKKCLPECSLVLASSEQVAQALALEYGIRTPLALENAPALEPELPHRPPGFRLYWRNAVIALSQRGLDYALQALTRLPADITLHIQGKTDFDGGAAVQARIAELAVADRVIIHPPYAPDDAVLEAAQHTVGLCLERKGVRNHDLTTSNKIFDYHMAGLAVVVSNLPGLSAVVARSQGGLLFKPGDVDDLTEKILQLYRDPKLLDQLARNAREFGLRGANREEEMKKFAAEFKKISSAQNIPPKRGTGFDLPILAYHHITKAAAANPEHFEITLRQFTGQLDALKAGGFETVHFSRLLRAMDGLEALPRRAVIITFDDGFDSFRELALPALRQRAMTATMFVPAGEIGGVNRWDTGRGIPERKIMDEAQLREIADAGIEIGAHGWAHRRLPGCNAEEMREEIFRARRHLQSLGFAAEACAYPYGEGAEAAVPLLREAGFRAAVTFFSDAPSVTASPYFMRRVYTHPGDSTFRFRLKLSRAYLRLRAWRKA